MLNTLQIGLSWFTEQPGGLDRYTAGLWPGLAAAGCGVRGLVMGTGAIARETGGMVRAVAGSEEKIGHRLGAMRAAFDAAVGEQRPDVVATHFALYGFPLRGELGKLPHVVHFHGPWAAEGGAEGQGGLRVLAKRWLERRVYRTGDRFICLSRAFERVLCEDYGVDRACVRVIPGGIDYARFACAASRGEARRRLGWPEDRPIVLVVRRLARRMGLEQLIDAVKLVRQKHGEALVLIAGRGRLESDLQNRIEAEGLAAHVKLLGFVPDDDLPLAYRGADVSLVPTQQLEGFGLITLESLAAGTPVLVTPVGGLPEVVGDLDAQLILADRGAQAIAEGVCAALNGEVKLPGEQACRDYVREGFDWPVIAKRVLSVYEEVA